MDDTPKRAVHLRRDNPLTDRLVARIAEYKARGEPYPVMRVANKNDVPLVWFGPAPYHAETLDRLHILDGKGRLPITLPDEFIITGDERLPREPLASYDKYLIYRDLGPERTLQKAARHWRKLRMSNKTDKLPYAAADGGVGRLAVRWRWHERCMAWDAKIETEARRTAEQRERDQMEAHIERRQTYLDNEYEFIDSTVKRIKQMLSFPVDRQRIVTETYPDGREKTITIIEPAKWTYASLAQIEGEVAKIARLHFGLSTSNASAKIEATVADARSSQQRPLSDEDRAAHAFAAARAETAYFDALEEWKAREKPLVATITETAAG